MSEAQTKEPPEIIEPAPGESELMKAVVTELIAEGDRSLLFAALLELATDLARLKIPHLDPKEHPRAAQFLTFGLMGRALVAAQDAVAKAKKLEAEKGRVTKCVNCEEALTWPGEGEPVMALSRETGETKLIMHPGDAPEHRSRAVIVVCNRCAEFMRWTQPDHVARLTEEEYIDLPPSARKSLAYAREHINKRREADRR